MCVLVIGAVPNQNFIYANRYSLSLSPPTLLSAVEDSEFDEFSICDDFFLRFLTFFFKSKIQY